MRQKRVILIALAALLAVALVPVAWPRTVLVAPEVTLTVVDSSGQRLSGICVWEYWAHYSVETIDHSYLVRSDTLGRAFLPQRTMRLSKLGLWLGNLINAVEDPVHSSYGPSSYAILRGPGLVGESVSLATASHRVVMRPEPDQPESMKQRLLHKCEPD